MDLQAKRAQGGGRLHKSSSHVTKGQESSEKLHSKDKDKGMCTTGKKKKRRTKGKTNVLLAVTLRTNVQRGNKYDSEKKRIMAAHWFFSGKKKRGGEKREQRLPAKRANKKKK